ncbi:MAG: RsmD family RNA methyltransferase [Sphingobacteriales bacterium]|jgi:16S rRNA (guanine(966)-N(2))-methyltransferase RsmD|nr:RsmD family RNA methyltransferase [Sphingobacteriales bacterium]
MRIISGSHRGLKLQAPAKLPVRPTTDMAKEALFNIIEQKVNIDEISVLDLFAGTGNISLEFSSRGVKELTSIDRHADCVRFIQEMNTKLKFTSNLLRADVFKYLKTCVYKYDLIFADPPYDLPNIPDIIRLVKENNLLNVGGFLIIEHASMQNLSSYKGYVESRKYGSSTFSFFE